MMARAGVSLVSFRSGPGFEIPTGHAMTHPT